MKNKLFILIFFILLIAASFKLYNSKVESFTEVSTPFPAYMYRPSLEGKHPALVILHGSEGGNGDFWHYPEEAIKNKGDKAFAPKLAKDFASKGYVTLALCYFDCKNHNGYNQYPPDELSDIDINEITGNAIKWLRSQPYVKKNNIGLLGGSRGAEHALLYASLIDPKSQKYPNAIVSLSPSNNITREFSHETAKEIISKGFSSSWPKKPAWKFGDTVPEIDTPIKIENFKNPLLITYFKKDSVWGSYVNIQKTIDRFSQAKIDFYQLTVNKNSSLENVMDKIETSENNIIFLKYDFSGHVYPHKKKENKAFQTQEKTIEWFLNKHLNN